MKTDDSIISSSCSSIEMEDRDIHELFSYHLNCDGTFYLSTQEFYDNVSSASTPSAVRSSDLLQRNGYDTDDSGFCENFVSDSELLLMSNLHLGDDGMCKSTTSSWQSDVFPLPKMCLLSQFEEYCENEVQSVENTPSTLHKQCEVTRKRVEAVDFAPCEQRVSARRQRSPDAVVERCSRHRRSLDSFSESPSDDSKLIRRSSDSFVPTHSVDEVFTALPPLVLDSYLPSNLPPLSVSDEPLYHISSATEAHIEPSQDNSVLKPSLAVDRVLNPSLDADRIFGPSPVVDVDEVLKEGLKSILAEFAPPCLGQLIGRKMGLHHVDIISELCDRSMSMIVRHICSYLADIDLCR